MKKTINILSMLLAASALQAQTLKDALTLTDNEQYEFADAAFKTLLQKEPANGTYWFYLGENYWKSDKPDSAKYAYEKGLATEPANPINLVGVGKYKLETGNQAGAKADFDKALTMSGSKTSLVQSEVAESYIANKNKDLTYAIKLLGNAISVDSKNPELYMLLGDAYSEQNNGTLAAENYNKALDFDKNAVKALVKKGQLYKRSTNFEGAAGEFESAIKLSPNYAPAHRELGEAYFKLRKMDMAKEEYKKYLEISKNNNSARLRYASFLFAGKDYAASQAELNQLSKIDSTNLSLLRLKGYNAHELNDTINSKYYLEKVMQLTNDNNRTGWDYDYYGKMLSKSGNDSLAAIYFEKSYNLDTTKTDILTDLGGMYMKLKNYPLAINAYERRVNYGKGLKSTDYFNLGKAYFFNNDFNRADTLFAKVTELSPTWPNGFLWRAQSNYKLDPDSKQGLAKPHYEKYIEVALADTANVDKYKNGLIESYKYLGSYYYLVDKQTSVSKSNWLKVLELAPDDKQAKQVLEGLNQKPK